MGAPRFDDWIPIRVFWRDGAAWVDWCHFGRTRLTEPFFRDSVGIALRRPFNQAFRRETPIAALTEWRHRQPGLEPTAFLHHASRCGSTLVSQMLAALGTHLVLSEPPMVDAVLGAHRMSPEIDRELQVEWLRGLVSALAQPRNGERAFFVKLDAWSVFDLAILHTAFPATPWIYLYRDPLEIAVSQLRQRGEYLIPGRSRALREVFGEEAMAMPADELVIRMLGRMLEAGAAGCASEGGLPMHYSELPGALSTTFRDVLRIPDDPASREALSRAARYDAKSPQLEFVADAERKQREVTVGLRALNERWAAPAYRALEQMRATARDPRPPAVEA